MDAFSPPERNRQKHQECQQVEHHHQTNHSWELVTFILRLLAVWLGGRCVAAAKADPLAGRIRRGRKLLDEIVHPALDLPDVAFHRVHPPLNLEKRSDLFSNLFRANHTRTRTATDRTQPAETPEMSTH